jgi:hypothetical protein
VRTMRPCNDCKRLKVLRRGLCSNCYQNRQRHGVELPPAMGQGARRPPELTPFRARLLEDLKAYIAEHGQSPTWRELQFASGGRSSDSVREAMRSLRALGLVAWSPWEARSLRLVDPAQRAPRPRKIAYCECGKEKPRGRIGGCDGCEAIDRDRYRLRVRSAS